MSMKQNSFATTGIELLIKRTRKREFLDEMRLVFPWVVLVGLIEAHAPHWQDGAPALCNPPCCAFTYVSMRPGKRRALGKTSTWGDLLDKAKQTKARLRHKVEHPFRVIKC